MIFQRIAERHTVRPLAPGDAEELFALTNANRAFLRRWLPWLDGIQYPADTLASIESSLRKDENNRGFHGAIVYDDRIAGVISYHQIDWHNRSTALGYWLAECYQGRGLMTASCRVLIDHAFAALNLHRVAIVCATGNVRSRGIPERLGFAHEGTLREAEWLYTHYLDHAVYAQLQSDWQQDIIHRLANPEGRAPARP